VRRGALPAYRHGWEKGSKPCGYLVPSRKGRGSVLIAFPNLGKENTTPNPPTKKRKNNPPQPKKKKELTAAQPAEKKGKKPVRDLEADVCYAPEKKKKEKGDRPATRSAALLKKKERQYSKKKEGKLNRRVV